MELDSSERLREDDICEDIRGNGTEKEYSTTTSKKNKVTSSSPESPKKSTSGHNTSQQSFTSRDTNSIDPDSVRCRVFIGNLNTDKIDREDIKKHFSKYGTVVGCSVHLNFGFVQFGTKPEADKAVTETHGSMLFGKRVDANIASERRRQHGNDRKTETTSTRGRPRTDLNGSPERYRSRSPRLRYDELYGSDDTVERNSRLMPRNYKDDRPLLGVADRDHSPGYSKGRSGPVYDYQPSIQNSSGCVDCEIIASSSDIRVYCDSIESRLLAMGVSASLMFPPSEIPVADIIDRIARRGCLYAIVISSQNEYHQSCTLNILHGAPQEHRNMPLDDALAFVARNFNHYLKDSKDSKERPSASASSVLSNQDEPMGRTILTQDSYISSILNVAAAGKPLKVLEVNHLIEALIKYKKDIDGSQGHIINEDPSEYNTFKRSGSERDSRPPQGHYIDDAPRKNSFSSNFVPLSDAGDFIGYPGYRF